jgi:chorismate mutase/prephenate dehydratase
MMPRSASLDAPPALAASADEAPPPQDGWPGGLPALRAELDRIDDALHALLMERARVVEQVAKSGKRGAYRPGREASIIRRLLRRHSGALPAQAVVRIWRELLAGTTAMQGPFTVAVCESDGGSAFSQVGREHFGARTPLHVHGSPSQAVAEVGRSVASVAVLPMPSETDAWWTELPQGVRVVARLPFWAARPDGTAAQALVIATTEPDPSGIDRSLLGLELGPDMDRPHLAAALTGAGFAPGMTVLCRDRVLAEVDGFVTDDDPRLTRLNGLRRPVVLGAYAIPDTEGAA